MPDNVKKGLGVALRRLLRPLIRIMLREGFTYSQFAAIARIAFVDCAAKDFGIANGRASASSVSALTGIPVHDMPAVFKDQDDFEKLVGSESSNPFARVIHAWHNDREYVGPYGFPIDLPFSGTRLSFTALMARHTPGVSPQVVLQELKRVKAVVEVGVNVWKPLVQEYIEPTLSPENVQRMASLAESLLATVERNTRGSGSGSELFERTMVVDSPLTVRQFAALQEHLKVVGAQFLHRVDTFAAVDLQEKMAPSPGERADIHAGLQCFLYVEPELDQRRLSEVVDLDGSTN